MVNKFLSQFLFYFVRNKKGKIVKPAPFQSSVTSGEVARVAPNRKWFGRYHKLYRKIIFCAHLCVRVAS